MPTPSTSPERPEVHSLTLLSVRDRHGRPVNVGVGEVDGGGVVLSTTAADGVALLTVEETSDLMGHVRRAMARAAADPRRS
ncbi:hypothetical protein [Saccharothrix xinjiangensis]|uniref:Uncharacterized protein n=1 Tax=Saccharothrix xinjiangensis TaxID=204798 RepID=A0ABV9XVS7_9PSEU